MSNLESRVRVVLPPVWPGVFTPVGDLIAAAMRTLGFAVDLVEVEADPNANLNVVLGWSLYEPRIPQGTRYALYQLEPLARNPWRTRLREQQRLFREAEAIWEYSEVNLPALDGLQVRLVPLRYHEALRRPDFDHPADWDVIFAGNMTPRRLALLKELSNHCAVTAQIRWGAEFERVLARSKMLLNIHQIDGPAPLEQPRVAFALNNDRFVLTETAADNPYPGLPTVPYGQLIETVLAYLHHPDRRETVRAEVCRAYREMTGMTEILAAALADIGIDHAPAATSAI